jgi:hypothetical protein
MIKEPIYLGILQSDLDFAGHQPVNLTGWPPTGGGGTGALPWISIKAAPYNAAGNGTTDDTTALQSAVNALAAVGGGRIYFPPGTYLIGGPLQDTGGSNAQILLPTIRTDAPMVVIEFIGALPPPTQLFIGSPLPSATAYSTIKSTLTGASGTAAFIGGVESSAGGFAGLWNNVMLVASNMIFQAPPNPSFTFFNCFDTMGPYFRHVLIHTGTFDYTLVTQPTHANAVGIKLAPSNHSAGQELDVVNVYGFYTGIQDGELAMITANVWSCKQAVLVPFTYHPSVYPRLGVFNCTKGIVAAGVGYSGVDGDNGVHYMRVIEYAGEFDGGSNWYSRVYDVDDSTNLLKGDLKWVTIQGGVGSSHTFIKNGGTGLLTGEIGT